MPSDRGDGNGSLAGPDEGFHHRSVDDTLDELAGDAGEGLSEDQAASRLAEAGANELAGSQPPS